MGESLNDRVLSAIGRHYELEGEIGRGGMSVVYRARDLRLNRPVAIKVLPPELAHDPAIRARFTREAQMSAQLSHAHIVPIYDVGERDGLAYFVMALVTGGNLGALLMREPRQPVDEVRRILCEVADALAYAHLRGVIHRDIKPDNILLDRQTGRAMVTDFGIAWAMEAGARLTATGIAVGTPTYMSPEQAVGERELDGRSDIYSLGILGYQMSTGRVPFEAANSMALLLKHVTERPRPIAELRPETPRALRDTIERAMMKAPEDRWPTATAMRDALTTGDASVPSWRADQREPVRYASPRPDGSRRVPAVRSPVPRRSLSRDDGDFSTPARNDGALAVPNAVRPSAPEIVMEPAHLAHLTPPQREDLRLWHGRVNLHDRIRAMRGYSWATLASVIGGIAGFAFGVEEVPPFVLAPLVPMYMSVKAWKRGKSLREAGLKLRRVLFMPRAKWVIPPPPPPPNQGLEKLAPREILEGPEGAVIRRAVDDRAAILGIVASLPKADRALISEVEPTVKAIMDRLSHLAHLLHRLDQSIDPNLATELDRRIADVEREGESADGERRLGLLRRQRTTLDELVKRRVTLGRQLDAAGLALGNLRLDLIKLRSSGLQSALSDISTATQEVRALSNEIDAVLAAASEVRGL
ncbi:MAG TPA: serine/threonine-protein kinase [Gemmatimonadaceae bacterium]|jgi:serine/threonine-protein kinase|nr:serine/threonine-protein kinase [Gemmatimonadaceae bacterium]